MGEGRLLRRAIKADRLTSIILYGPPGSGKTTLAGIIARESEAEFERLNAVMSGVADIRRVAEEAKKRLGMYQKRTLLFIDEVHRFNKAQQDALLPSVEKGIVTFIGATTENPYFEVIAPLVSRSRVFELQPLNDRDVKQIVMRALKDKERGLGEYDVSIEETGLQHIVRVAAGDARSALNAIELAVLTTEPDENGTRHITLEIASESIQQRALNYDGDGDAHYDTVSAFIKSIRGSDPDAALYWLARMIYGGEEPRFIARRLMVHASEDIGLADPRALQVAVSCSQAVERVGMPEGRIILAQATLYLATAPKSNSALSIDKALDDVREGQAGGVPLHLRDSHYSGAEDLDRGSGYKYPHDHPDRWIRQQYLPDGLVDSEYYKPSEQGYEKKINQFLDRLKQDKNSD